MYAQTIAIDGPAGSGKSTIGAKLAEALDYVFVDAGMLYRAITGKLLEHQQNIHDESAVIHFARTLDIHIQTGELSVEGAPIDTDLHSHAITQAVPIVAAYPEVRACVRKIQQQIAQAGKVVFSGRDIGTVVLPHAELKIYLNPSLEERARRRHAATPNGDLEQILNELHQRDRLDSTRHESPLKIAEDALVISTDKMTIEEVLTRIIQHAQKPSSSKSL